MPTVTRYAEHSPYSAPGPYADRVRALPDDVESLCAAARNVIVHYRAQLPAVTPERVREASSRWVAAVLRHDDDQHGDIGLLTPRELESRVGGCCRDHALFVVAALRERGVPARTRVGFAHYLDDDPAATWAYDHVITEYWDESRWVRTDPEFPHGSKDFDVRDMSAGADSPFESAAHAWLRFRRGDTDLASYGVYPGAPLSGPLFVRAYVIFQLAHRFGDELLLWDGWGATNPNGDDSISDAEIDELARLLVVADGDGDEARAADDQLWDMYREDPRLRPGDTVLQFSPLGDPPVEVSLVAGSPS